MRFRTNDAERMRILSNGRIGMNRTAVNGAAILDISHPGSSEYGLTLDSSNTSGTQYHLDIRRGGTQAGYLVSGSTSVTLANSSDERLKDNVTLIEEALHKVSQIRGVEFDWNDKQEIYTGHDTGIIAQDVQKVLPEVIEEREDGYLAVKYEKMIPLLIEGIKEQQEQIDELKKEIEELKNA